MISSTPSELFFDNEDGFDWDAAVQEIDEVCSSAAEKKNCNQAGVLSSSSNPDARKRDSCDGYMEKSHDPEENDVYSPGPEDENVEILNQLIKIDSEAAKNWIYPVNFPRRDYQFSIARTSLFSNTLVVLPTGLGKTLIAAVVMYNYFRWFPEGKIVFAAPSRPLVLQQIQACHKIVGIPQEWTIDLTGQTNPTTRAEFWKSKRVFFVTPQVLERDIRSGSCVVSQMVCLVIDEAHRAMGNYSYCVVVRELMDARVQLRILALSATPGYKKQTIQSVIDNLQISSLEYRTESDPDVLPYVNERKIDLIEVAMGNAAAEIDKRLLELVRPFVARLSSLGVLYSRDLETLSPCHLLNSRDKFRQERPLDFPHTNYGEVEGYFGVLITLYHIRKLLSSHGIQPAFEMLDEKLKQGSFARFVSRNETLLKAKLLMEQSVSTGTPSPKLSKLLEVLTDHFKRKDPLNSRVIIFSNFRGSVRDILNALRNIGDIVKATEFIGQSSGKTMKGQSQKAQQAVLEKFRAGGYNVIVATSIGEEGLDIMEVDLVVCFDANVSPLRMIQRMGRTGRQHEGRVVVLACEGPELKGYMRKQRNSKGIKKHLSNGGIKSFNFHSCPRMVPHVFTPEVQFLEMSIKKFVHHRRKVKDDNDNVFDEGAMKLTNAETLKLAKYFTSVGGISWRPSLIAFPQFQEFPSPVNKVFHSSRSEILVDVMKHLQSVKFQRDNNYKTPLVEEVYLPDSRLKDGGVRFKDHEAVEDSENGADAIEDLPLNHKDGQSKPFAPCFSPNEEVCCSPESNIMLNKDHTIIVDDPDNNLGEAELSPRLISFIESGTVPESPLIIPGARRCDSPSPAIVSSSSLQKSFYNGEEAPQNVECLSNGGIAASPLDSDDDALHAPPTPVEKQFKYRRLRKIGDFKQKQHSLKGNQKTSDALANDLDKGPSVEKMRRKRASIYIEEEAEASPNAVDSSGEEDDNSLYEGSFIDDGANPSVSASTQAGVNDSTMMAIYRQSLLSQSLFRKPASTTTSSLSSGLNETMNSSSGNVHSSDMHQTRTGLEESTGRNYRISDSRKRKISFYGDEGAAIPRINLDKEFSSTHENRDVLEDDDSLFDGIDLDAIEMEATKMIQQKSELTTTIPQPSDNGTGILWCPSFDLGV